MATTGIMTQMVLLLLSGKKGRNIKWEKIQIKKFNLKNNSNKKSSLTEKEQLNLRQQAKKSIETIEKLCNYEDNNKILNEFKNKFILCETAYKTILKNFKKDEDESKLKINMNQVATYLKKVGYNFDYELLDKIFSYKNEKGSRSAKFLRNEVSHKPNKSSVDEIVNRKDELFGYMDEFINVIKTFDDENNKANNEKKAE